MTAVPEKGKLWDFPGSPVVRTSPSNAGGVSSIPGWGAKNPQALGPKHKIEAPWRRKWQPTLVFLSEKSHGQRSLAGYSPWGPKESDTTEPLTHDTMVGS